MINKKTKSLYPVTLTDVKRHLRIDLNYFDDDEYIENSIIPSATKFCENYIGEDIALTSNVMTIYDFIGSAVKVDEGNLVSIDNIISDSSTLITDYTLVNEGKGYFTIEFSPSLDEDPLKIEFTTGYESGECPDEIKQAIYIECGNLFDVTRSNYVYNGIQNIKAVERILNYFKITRW